MKRRLVLSLTLLFFFGGPLVGLFYFWGLAHRQMENDAKPFARRSVEEIFGRWDFTRLSDLATLRYRPKLSQAEFDNWKTSYGAFEGIDSIEALRSYAGAVEAEQQVWQFVDLRMRVRFANGPVVVDFKAARRSIPPDWRIEELKLTPAR